MQYLATIILDEGTKLLLASTKKYMPHKTPSIWKSIVKEQLSIIRKREALGCSMAT